MSQRAKKSRIRKIEERYLLMRDQLWPDLDEDRLWNRKKKAGFTTIPRTMPLIGQIMDHMSGGKKVSSTYLVLWCRLFENSMVVIENEGKMAFEAGFSGQRAILTWKTRMKKLLELQFIDAKAGPSSQYNYVLIWNPYQVIRDHLKTGQLNQDVYYTALLERAMEIGAEEDLT